MSAITASTSATTGCRSIHRSPRHGSAAADQLPGDDRPGPRQRRTSASVPATRCTASPTTRRTSSANLRATSTGMQPCWPTSNSMPDGRGHSTWRCGTSLGRSPTGRCGGCSADPAAGAGVCVDRCAPVTMWRWSERPAVHDIGFAALKVRFGRRSLADDIAVVGRSATRSATRSTLMVDCNQAWRMPWDTARRGTSTGLPMSPRRSTAEHVYWVEEPLPRGGYPGSPSCAAVSV